MVAIVGIDPANRGNGVCMVKAETSIVAGVWQKRQYQRGAVQKPTVVKPAIATAPAFRTAEPATAARALPPAADSRSIDSTCASQHLVRGNI